MGTRTNGRSVPKVAVAGLLALSVGRSAWGDGVFVQTWGNYGSGSGQFNLPYAVAVDAASNVFVADMNNNRIQEFTGSGAFIRAWGTLGTGTVQFNGPSGVAVDPTGNVFVADTYNHRIQEFNNSGSFIR